MSDALQDAILATVDPTRAPPPAAPADVAQPPEDPLTGAIRQVVSDGAQAQDFDTKIAAMRATHSTLSPEHAVEAGKLAAVTGLDPSYVADNLDTIRPQVTQDQLARALRDKPGVARLMRSAEKAAIVKDDVANLGALEWLFTGRWDKVAEGGIFGYSMTTPPALARAMGQGIDEQRIALLSARQMAGTASPAEMTELDSLEASAQRNLVSDAEAGFLGAAKHHLAESFVGGARMLPYIAGNFAARAAGGLVGAVAGPAGATAGQYGAGAAFDFYQQVGPLYRSLKKLGVLTDNEARGYAVATAGAMSLLTAGLAGKMIGALPPVKAALEKIAGQTVTQALTERTVRGAITGAAKQYGEHVGAGAALMVAQSAANATAAQVALATHGEKFDAAPIVRAAGDAAQRAVTDLALLSAWGPGRGLLRNLGERSQLRADAAEIAGVAQAAEASKAVERDPRVVDALAQGKLYYADAPGWDAYWTAQGLAPRDVAAKLLADGGKAYDEARAASGAFAVPASKLAELVRTAHGKAAQELFRAKPDGLSIAEAKRHDAVLEQRLKDLDADAQIKTDAEQIHALEKAKALDAGEHESVADAYATMRVSNLKHYMAATGRGTLPEWYQRVGDLQIVRGAEAAPPKVQAAIMAAHAVATVPPRPVEAPPAAAAGTTGKRTGQVITPQRPGGEPVRYDVIEAADLVPSHNPQTFDPHGSGTLFQDEAGRWQLHLSTDPNAITQEMAPLGIARVGVPSKIDRAGHDFAARDPLAQTQEMPVLEGLDRLEQTRKDEARGFIEFHPTGGGEPVRATIHLLNGDRSTLAHETMHFFFESLSRIASAADAPEGVRDDYAKLLDFAGYGSHQERQALTAERVMLASKAERAPVEQARLNDLVAREERVTHAWEQYLAEGKAPAKELRGVFRRFKLWMIGIYRGISGPAGQFQNAFGQELPALSDDVRKVFGRLLGAQDGLKAANEDVAGLPDEVMGKLQPGERAQVDEAAATAAERGEQEVVRSLAEDDRGETARFLRDERERIRAEVTAETDQEPGYRALAALRSGEGAQVGIDGKPLRLSKPLTAPEFARDPRLRGIWATEGVGLEPDQMAGVLGFDDGRTLLETLRDQEPRDQRIERLTADKLQEQYGGLVSEAQKVAAAALAATHEDAAARKVIWEWRAIYRAMGKEPPALDLAQVRYTAERLVAEKRIDELRPERHLASERAAAQRAYDLARTGALDKAAAEKESQILSRELWRAAKNAREIADAAREKIEGTASDKWRATLGKADPLLRDLHDDLLAAVGLGEERGVRGKIDDALASLSPGEIGFDVQSIRDVLAQRPGWGGLTVGEALDVRDAVKSLRHIARAINEVTIEGQKRDRAEVIAQIGEDAARLPDMGKMLADKTQRTVFQRALRAIQAGDANLLEPEVLFEFLGPTAHKVIWDAYLSGRALKDRLSKTVLDFFAKRWEEMPQAMRDRRYEPIADLDRTLPIPEDVAQAGPRSRQWLWMVALNMGNEGNRDRLLGGYGWEEAHVLDVLRQHLDKSEWDFVQSIWSLADKELWPLLAEKEEQRTGLVPEKVKATPIETPHGTYEGGYFPAKYDPRPGQSRLGARQAEAGLAAASTTYGQTSTAKGHTKKRASTYSDTINLQWEVVPSHLAQVIHDLAFDQVTRETARLINDRGMQQILAQRLGEERAMQPNAWLKVVASAQADAVPQHLQTFMANTLGGMRSRAALGAMGWSLSVSMAQLTHPFIAAAAGEVSLRHLLPVLGQTLAKWGDLRTDGLANSAELLHRSGHFAEKLREEIGDVGAQGAAAGPLETVRRTAWSFLEAVDALTSTIIFQARKRQGLAEGLDLAAANKTADRAVRSMMPAHDMAEEPSILRDRRGVGALLMFHGFFSKLYNQTRRMAHEPYLAWNDPTESKASAAAKTAAAAGRALAMIGVASLGGEFLAGHGAEDDETWGQWLARKALAAPFGMIPFASNIAEPVADKLVTDRVRQVSVRSAPMLSVIQQVVDTIGNLTNENREGSKKAWDLVELALTGAKMPARQPRRTGEFLTDWLWTGDARPQDASDVASGVFYGHRDHQPATPFAPGMH